MNTTELNKVSPLKYDIYNKILAMAEFYFGEDSDYLKTGFMGWLIECMTMFIRDSSLQKTMLKNEGTLNTAIMTKTIYEYAKMFGINIPQATPASCDFVLTLDCNELDTMIAKRKGKDHDAKYGYEVRQNLSGTDCLIIDRKNGIQVDTYTYMLERSIIIYKNNNQSYIVKYCNTETPDTTNFGDKDDNILKTVLREDPETGNRYLSFTVKAFQYKTTTITKQITSSAFIETENHTFEFDDQFCGVRLKYKKGNDEISIPLYFSDAERSKNVSVYGYYDLIDDQTLKISFKPSVFLPSVGSTLTCEIYSTVGASGNRQFNTQPVMSLSDETYKSMSILVSFEDYTSIGGKDKISNTDLKQNIIRELASRDVIVTEEDLNNYFQLLGGFFESINDGQVRFIKKRDDLIRRTFNAYVLLRDGFGINGELNPSSNYRSELVPTNTVDVTYIPEGPIDVKKGLSLSDNIIEKVLNQADNTVTYNFKAGSNAELTDTKDKYFTPFRMQVYLSPIRTVKYIYDLTDDSTSLSYKNITNSSTLYMSPSTVSLKRGTGNNGYYYLTFLFNTDFNLENTWNNTPIILKIYNGSTYSEYKLNKDNNVFSVKSEKQDDNETLFKSKIEIILKPTKDQFVMVDASQENIQYGQQLCLTYGDGSNAPTININEEAKVGIVIDSTFENQAYNCEFISDKTLTWFKNLDDIMSSDLIVTTETKSSSTGTENGATATADTEGGTTTNTTKITSITIKEVPIIARSFYDDVLDNSKFIQTLLTYIDILKDNKAKLETNTTFNLKFMNTFGESESYTSTTTNIRLQLRIWLKTTSDETIVQEIRSYIRHLVDMANSAKKLRVSTVLAMVTASYNQFIDHIDFLGLNGTFDQFIESTGIDPVVPEYFNLDREHLEEDITFFEAGVI